MIGSLLRTNILIVVVMVFGCAIEATIPSSNQISCNQEWYEWVEGQIGISDSQHHGPDLGSQEWKHAVEYRLGVRDKQNKPSITSEQWCQYAHSLI